MKLFETPTNTSDLYNPSVFDFHRERGNIGVGLKIDLKNSNILNKTQYRPGANRNSGRPRVLPKDIKEQKIKNVCKHYISGKTVPKGNSFWNWGKYVAFIGLTSVPSEKDPAQIKTSPQTSTNCTISNCKKSIDYPQTTYDIGQQVSLQNILLIYPDQKYNYKHHKRTDSKCSTCALSSLKSATGDYSKGTTFSSSTNTYCSKCGIHVQTPTPTPTSTIRCPACGLFLNTTPQPPEDTIRCPTCGFALLLKPTSPSSAPATKPCQTCTSEDQSTKQVLGCPDKENRRFTGSGDTKVPLNYQIAFTQCDPPFPVGQRKSVQTLENEQIINTKGKTQNKLREKDSKRKQEESVKEKPENKIKQDVKSKSKERKRNFDKKYKKLKSISAYSCVNTKIHTNVKKDPTKIRKPKVDKSEKQKNLLSSHSEISVSFVKHKPSKNNYQKLPLNTIGSICDSKCSNMLQNVQDYVNIETESKIANKAVPELTNYLQKTIVCSYCNASDPYSHFHQKYAKVHEAHQQQSNSKKYECSHCVDKIAASKNESCCRHKKHHRTKSKRHISRGHSEHSSKCPHCGHSMKKSHFKESKLPDDLDNQEYNKPEEPVQVTNPNFANEKVCTKYLCTRHRKSKDREEPHVTQHLKPKGITTSEFNNNQPRGSQTSIVKPSQSQADMKNKKLATVQQTTTSTQTTKKKKTQTGNSLIMKESISSESEIASTKPIVTKKQSTTFQENTLSKKLSPFPIAIKKSSDSETKIDKMSAGKQPTSNRNSKTGLSATEKKTSSFCKINKKKSTDTLSNASVGNKKSATAQNMSTRSSESKPNIFKNKKSSQDSIRKTDSNTKKSSKCYKYKCCKKRPSTKNVGIQMSNPNLEATTPTQGVKPVISKSSLKRPESKNLRKSSKMSITSSQVTFDETVTENIIKGYAKSGKVYTKKSTSQTLLGLKPEKKRSKKEMKKKRQHSKSKDTILSIFSRPRKQCLPSNTTSDVDSDLSSLAPDQNIENNIAEYPKISKNRPNQNRVKKQQKRNCCSNVCQKSKTNPNNLNSKRKPELKQKQYTSSLTSEASESTLKTPKKKNLLAAENKTNSNLPPPKCEDTCRYIMEIQRLTEENAKLREEKHKKPKLKHPFKKSDAEPKEKKKSIFPSNNFAVNEMFPHSEHNMFEQEVKINPKPVKFVDSEVVMSSKDLNHSSKLSLSDFNATEGNPTSESTSRSQFKPKNNRKMDTFFSFLSRKNRKEGRRKQSSTSVDSETSKPRSKGRNKPLSIRKVWCAYAEPYHKTAMVVNTVEMFQHIKIKESESFQDEMDTNNDNTSTDVLAYHLLEEPCTQRYFNRYPTKPKRTKQIHKNTDNEIITIYNNKFKQHDWSEISNLQDYTYRPINLDGNNSGKKGDNNVKMQTEPIPSHQINREKSTHSGLFESHNLKEAYSQRYCNYIEPKENSHLHGNVQQWENNNNIAAHSTKCEDWDVKEIYSHNQGNYRQVKQEEAKHVLKNNQQTNNENVVTLFEKANSYDREENKGAQGQASSMKYGYQVPGEPYCNYNEIPNKINSDRSNAQAERNIENFANQAKKFEHYIPVNIDSQKCNDFPQTVQEETTYVQDNTGRQNTPICTKSFILSGTEKLYNQTEYHEIKPEEREHVETQEVSNKNVATLDDKIGEIRSQKHNSNQQIDVDKSKNVGENIISVDKSKCYDLVERVYNKCKPEENKSVQTEVGNDNITIDAEKINCIIKAIVEVCSQKYCNFHQVNQTENRDVQNLHEVIDNTNDVTHTEKLKHHEDSSSEKRSKSHQTEQKDTNSVQGENSSEKMSMKPEKLERYSSAELCGEKNSSKHTDSDIFLQIDKTIPVISVPKNITKVTSKLMFENSGNETSALLSPIHSYEIPITMRYSFSRSIFVREESNEQKIAALPESYDNESTKANFSNQSGSVSEVVSSSNISTDTSLHQETYDKSAHPPENLQTANNVHEDLKECLSQNPANYGNSAQIKNFVELENNFRYQRQMEVEMWPGTRAKLNLFKNSSADEIYIGVSSPKAAFQDNDSLLTTLKYQKTRASNALRRQMFRKVRSRSTTQTSVEQIRLHCENKKLSSKQIEPNQKIQATFRSTPKQSSTNIKRKVSIIHSVKHVCVQTSNSKTNLFKVTKELIHTSISNIEIKSSNEIREASVNNIDIQTSFSEVAIQEQVSSTKSLLRYISESEDVWSDGHTRWNSENDFSNRNLFQNCSNNIQQFMESNSLLMISNSQQFDGPSQVWSDGSGKWKSDSISSECVFENGSEEVKTTSKRILTCMPVVVTRRLQANENVPKRVKSAASASQNVSQKQFFKEAYLGGQTSFQQTSIPTVTSNSFLIDQQRRNNMVKRVYHHCSCGKMMKIDVVKNY